MLFMVAGYLTPGAEEQLIQFRNEFSEHLNQAPLVAGGALRDQNLAGRKSAVPFAVASRSVGSRAVARAGAGSM